MSHYPSSLALAVFLGGIAASPALAQGGGGSMEGMTTATNESLVWTDADIPGFAPGMKMAVIHGNPGEDGPYTLRLSFPDGYRFPPHWHPMAENVTVLTGMLQLGMGPKVEASKLKAYAPGSYLHIPATQPHFGGAVGLTVIQLHGQGPFAINLVEAASR
jgi:quercetin dioxygenase-like cupin family protein